MKKTLIALAAAASCSVMAATSGAPGAWIPNGAVGEVQIGGTLTPQEKVTPWEINPGGPAGNLNGFVQKGLQQAVIRVENAIPVLGIRTHLKEPFLGEPGIAPQIDFKGAIDPAKFSGNGTATLTLDIKNSQSKKIGHLQAPLFAGAEYSYTGRSTGKSYMTARNPGDAFYGGLSQASEPVGNNIYTRVSNISYAFIENYNDQGAPLATSYYSDSMSDNRYKFSAYYGSGIEAGSKINITLDAPATAEAIEWRASLPVSVSYQ
ncbi:hypothetical protein JZC05_004222 [Salmonella enterica subsp. enterica serovar Oranienburg]|nr:hypothetical protein [Salmonella enterica subsp. enterica serovar Oranienburg]EHE7835210.1 hypothetical protein [Salmonella enterica subsp. enterica serovar Oranienburg]